MATSSAEVVLAQHHSFGLISNPMTKGYLPLSLSAMELLLVLPIVADPPRGGREGRCVVKVVV